MKWPHPYNLWKILRIILLLWCVGMTVYAIVTTDEVASQGRWTYEETLRVDAGYLWLALGMILIPWISCIQAIVATIARINVSELKDNKEKERAKKIWAFELPFTLIYLLIILLLVLYAVFETDGWVSASGPPPDGVPPMYAASLVGLTASMPILTFFVHKYILNDISSSGNKQNTP